jgi:thiol-disulfide isomerase/thioredoxin
MNYPVPINQFASFSGTSWNDARADKPKLVGFVCIVLLSIFALPVAADSLQQTLAEPIPHVNQYARENYIQYQYAENNKAFAIAPGGTWAWTESEVSKENAEANALQRCQRYTEQICVLYSLNDEIVFDAEAWPHLWRTEPKQKVKTNVTGVARGNLFPNLRFNDKQGKPRALSNFKGKIILLHFWGSWCGPCLREMPHLVKMQAALKQKHDNEIAIILLQVREPFSISQQWAIKNQFEKLPLYDSGVKGSEDDIFKTVDGKSYADRQLAKAFPASYVLDRKGNVLFSHKGPISNWNEYLAFFSNIVKHDN